TRTVHSRAGHVSFLNPSGAHQHIHSFPTRRSSDLRNNNALAAEYLTRLWNTNPPTGQWRYYNGMVYFLSMLNCAGMFKIYKPARSEEHTSELQSRENLVCRLLREKKKDAGE